MPYTPEQVYKPENLKFATAGGKFHKGPRKGEVRAPTLYFRTNHGSGRLRQEHDKGPKVQEIRKHTSHAFFKTKQGAIDFHEELKTTPNLTRDLFREIRTRHGATNRPFQDAFHQESTFTGHGGDSPIAKRGLHRSGGQVVVGDKLEALRGQTTAIANRMGIG
ncbi:hypothetical protein R50073_03990 [Maricurvus nonylphenolicus]|uniref:hypothetical protein n=1 Tax=Maricurvus nonylphenolicus TaxID=1008307 RepID=UPI0036F29261